MEIMALIPTKRPPVWVLLIVGLLSAHFIGILVMIRIATKNASGGVIPDYYTQAVNWDKIQEQQRASDALKWSLSVVPSTKVDNQGNRKIDLYLSDADNKPIEKAGFKLSAHPITRPDEAIAVSVVEIQPGQYQGSLHSPNPGRWTFDVVATRDASKFIHSADSFFSNR